LILYRVSNHADLLGKGGELVDGRWHTRAPGRRIVYLADHPALCLLETLVHFEREQDMPDTYQLMSVDIPDNLIEELDQTVLSADWKSDLALTQRIGNDWLSESQQGTRKPAILVPSVIVPVGHNCLLNPLATEHRITMTVLGHFPFDRRLS